MENEKIIREYVKHYNEFNLDGMLGLMTDDVCFENIMNGETDVKTTNIAELEQIAGISLNIFSERQQTIKSITIKGDSYVVEIDYYGRIADDLPNGLKQGDEIKLSGKSIYKFRDGKICSLTDIS